MSGTDVLAKTLVLAPVALLLAAAVDLGGVRPTVEQAVLRSAEAVAQPVADELLERLPWPGPRAGDGPVCVLGPYPAEHPCVVRSPQAPT